MKRLITLLAIMVLGLLAAGCSPAATPPEATVAPAEGAGGSSSRETPVSTEPPPTAAPSETATAEPTETTEPTATAAPTATDEPTATTAPTAEPTATAPAATGEPPAAANASVTIEDFEFTPANLTVSAGTTVTWTHLGDVRHTVTADDGSFDSPTLSGGDTFEFTFTTPGTYAYYCRFHGGAGGSGMSGVIVVSP